MTVIVDRSERLVDFHVLAVRESLDDSGFDAVLENCPVAAL